MTKVASAMTKISIIMPFKNAGKYLDACLHSIRNQSFTNWELIAVNDHSEDKSEVIVRRHSAADKRISVLSNDGSGIIPALRMAFQFAHGTYITRMDADDLMPEERLTLMYEKSVTAAPGTVVTGLVRYFGEQPISDGYQKYERWLNEINLNGTSWQHVYRECVIASPNWMVSRKDLLDIGGFDALRYPEDYHLVLKWYQAQFELLTIPQVTLLWREHPERTSRNSDHYSQEVFFRMKIKAFLETDWKHGALVLWGKNPKTKITAQLLKEEKIDFEQYDMKDYEKVNQLKHPQILVGVYPEKLERNAITSYLNNLGLKLGTDWWWL